MDKRCHRRRHPAKIQKGNALLRHSPCDCSICKSADLPYVHSAYHLDVLASGSDFSAFPADHACESPAENMENAKPSVRRPAAGTLCGIKAGSVRKVRFLPFFLPNIISIASALLLLPKSSGLGISCLIGASCGLVFWLAAVWMDRQPVSVISTDSDVNINYARAKKNLWKNFWLISCWLNTALILFLEILTLSARHMGICSIAGMIVYTLLLLLLCIFCMIKLKKIDRSYAQKRNLTSDENDDRNWIGGILYYNPSDPHTMVEQRVGIGTTVNMATSLGKGLTIFSAIMMLSCPLLCIWLIQEEFTPIDLVIQNHTLCAQHLKTDYQIPLSEIKDPTLLTASDLPDWTRTYGTSMDTLEKGTFTISGGEDVNVFLNPENDAFIQFSANGKTYYMGGVDDTQTKGIYEELLTH